MSHRVALCDGFDVEVGKVADSEQNSGKFWQELQMKGNGNFKDFRGSKIKQDKGCMPPRGGNCRFTPTGNAVRELQSVLLFTLCVKTSTLMCRNLLILKRNTGIQKVFRKGKCYE